MEGRGGFLAAYSGDPNPSLVLKDLSDDFLIARTSVKPHACCRWKHGPIDCLLDLKRTYGISTTWTWRRCGLASSAPA